MKNGLTMIFSLKVLPNAGPLVVSLGSEEYDAPQLSKCRTCHAEVVATDYLAVLVNFPVG